MTQENSDTIKFKYRVEINFCVSLIEAFEHIEGCFETKNFCTALDWKNQFSCVKYSRQLEN